MEENRQDKDLTQAEVNNAEEPRTSRQTRHTWIGDKDEIRPDYSERPVSRVTFSDYTHRDTRMVEREKRPYRGFITDEEVRNAEAAAEIDRRAREESMAARATMTQTRVYSGFGSTIDEPERPEDTERAEETAPKPVKKKRRRSVTIDTSDSNKVRRLIIVLMVFVLLLAYEISFAVMKAGTAVLPGKTGKLKSEISTYQANNTELRKTEEEMGEYGDIKDLRDSWQTIKDKLTE